jgi:50S ribosomal protein L16 3-hydroxylase
MNIDQSLPLLGGLSPAHFMRRHWQKKPLLVRGAVPQMQPLLSRAQLFDMAQQGEVESRLVTHFGREGWTFRRGPFARRALPSMSKPGWTLLVQGVDLHVQSAHELLSQFRFVPQARLDDLMISWASDGGGVGPHFDSYDVFLLQAQGTRRWRIGRQKDLSLRDDMPLKILANFEPEAEYLLGPGDMLYLPPRYAHDGLAQGECQTYSIGFRAPARAELAQELLQRIADEAAQMPQALYADRAQEATATPGEIPAALRAYAQDALRAALDDPLALDRVLGEYLTEPKASVWFEPKSSRGKLQGVALDRRTSMMYDAKHVFINGEGYLAAGRDAKLMRKLADERMLSREDLARASEGALALLASWRESGWLNSA